MSDATATTPTSSEPSSTTASSPTHKWSALGYQQVPGLANRHIARYLRTHRKGMMRFFYERGMLEQFERMQQIKRSRQGMMQKNRMFQEVLDEYARLVSPTVQGSDGGAPQEPAPEAADTSALRDVAVQPLPVGGDDAVRDGTDAAAGVSPVAGEDVGSGVVIEE